MTSPLVAVICLEQYNDMHKRTGNRYFLFVHRTMLQQAIVLHVNAFQSITTLTVTVRCYKRWTRLCDYSFNCSADVEFLPAVYRNWNSITLPDLGTWIMINLKWGKLHMMRCFFSFCLRLCLILHKAMFCGSKCVLRL